MVSKELANRNARIRFRIMGLMAEKSPRGRQKYTSGYIYDKVAAENGLKPRTVKNIFWNSGIYGLTDAPQQNVAQPA